MSSSTATSQPNDKSTDAYQLCMAHIRAGELTLAQRQLTVAMRRPVSRETSAMHLRIMALMALMQYGGYGDASLREAARTNLESAMHLLDTSKDWQTKVHVEFADHMDELTAWFRDEDLASPQMIEAKIGLLRLLGRSLSPASPIRTCIDLMRVKYERRYGDRSVARTVLQRAYDRIEVGNGGLWYTTPGTSYGRTDSMVREASREVRYWMMIAAYRFWRPRSWLLPRQIARQILADPFESSMRMQVASAVLWHVPKWTIPIIAVS